MSIRNQRGFTIIELMLFLAVSAALFAALMIGVNSNIVQQQYRDSVMSYSGLLQQQYSEVANTLNERDDKWRCDASQVESVVTGGEARGTTSCVIMGRFVQVVDDGANIKTGSIIGSRPVASDELQSDTEAISAYRPKVSPVDTTTQAISWRSRLVTTEGGPSTISFVIIRSPLSGLVRVYNSTDAMPADLTAMLNEDSTKRVVKACVASAELLSGPTFSVSINPSVAGPNGVIINGNDEEC